MISPSTQKGQEWVPPSVIYATKSGQGEIDRFAASKEPEMLGLVARYDGIDLPGDACRLLILDRLPAGESLIDRFVDESIRVETIRISRTATRVVQAIGRIFRSNTDHGVVLLVGSQLQSWLRTPGNRQYLPELLQQQILLGIELARQVDSNETTWAELVDGVLTGDENWDELYDEYINQFEAVAGSPSSDWHVKLILEERSALDQLWDGQYQQAANSYAALANAAQKHDPRLAAWYHHWAGLGLLCAEDRQGAFQEFILAANVRSELGRPSAKRETAFRPPAPSTIGKQAKNLATWYRKNKNQISTAIRTAETDLSYGPETARAEEAIKVLGALLGLHTERPDKSNKTGPDVSWQGDGWPSAWGFELKTDKDKEGEYFKKDIAQCHDHAEWLTANHGEDAQLSIVGRMLPVAKQANPSS